MHTSWVLCVVFCVHWVSSCVVLCCPADDSEFLETAGQPSMQGECTQLKASLSHTGNSNKVSVHAHYILRAHAKRKIYFEQHNSSSFYIFSISLVIHNSLFIVHEFIRTGIHFKVFLLSKNSDECQVHVHDNVKSMKRYYSSIF